jgi:hypothetical protein
MPKPLSDEKLLAYSGEHVFYEVKMFFWLAVALAKRTMTVTTATPDDALWLRNTLIEGFVLHLRNLLEFIFLEVPKDEHVIAAQFCQPETWKARRPAKSEALKRAWGRASREMVHLTTERIAGRPPEKNWDSIGIADEIAPILRLLVSVAEPSRISPAVARALEEYEGLRRPEGQRT